MAKPVPTPLLVEKVVREECQTLKEVPVDRIVQVLLVATHATTRSRTACHLQLVMCSL